MQTNLIILFIFFGAIIMSLAIWETRHIFQYVNKNTYKMVWKMLWFLMVFFLVGYGIALFLFWSQNYNILLSLMGLIFFFGAIFVLVVAKIGILTMKDLIKSITYQMELKKEKATIQAINQEKSLFLATMSHEIRTPMNAILGMTNLLLDTQIDSQQKELLEIVKSSGDSLLVIINDILDLSKIEAGKFTLQENNFNLRICVENLVDLVYPQVAQKGLFLVVYIDKNVPDIIGTDMNRLRQVLLNLINNAIKFTEKGYIVLKIFYRQENIILFEVEDTGIGIANNQTHKLFGLFSQIDSAVNRRYQGTGLGLAISKKIIEILNGEIFVESKLNKGTKFSFYIQAKTSFISHSSNLTFWSKLSQFKQKRILFISAEQNIFYEFICQQLFDWDFKVIYYSSDENNLNNELDKNNYDLIFLDYNTLQNLSVITQENLANANALDKITIVLLATNQEKIHSLSNLFPLQLYPPLKQNNLLRILTEGLKINLSNLPGSKKDQDQENEQIDWQRLFPARILVAEDNKVNQKVIRLVFKKLGYEIDIVNNGFEVLETFQDNHYDLIFMDISMPGMDGLEATSALLQQYPQKKCPVIAMTANVMQEDKDKCFKVGMNDFIAKPIQIEEIERIIQQWV